MAGKNGHQSLAEFEATMKTGGKKVKPLKKGGSTGSKKLATVKTKDGKKKIQTVRMKTGGSTGGNWIQGAIKKPGSLRKSLGVKKGNKIPKGKLEAAAHKKGKLGKRARLAETLEGFNKK